MVRRDKKAFLSDQCKEIEQNNRNGKTRDLFKKIRDTKGTFHAKLGSIKDRNGMNLTEAENIKRRQEYTVELYKKGLNDTDNQDDVVTLKVEPSRPSEASLGGGIPAELFQILKDDAVKVLHSICQRIWKIQ